MSGSFGGDGGKFFVVLCGLLIKTRFLRRQITENNTRKESRRGNAAIEFDGGAKFSIIDRRKLDIPFLLCEL